MSTSRSYRRRRLQQEQELDEIARRRRYSQLALEAALVERTAPGIAPVEPAALQALFAAAPARAWASLAQLSPAQLVDQAIEYTCFLELAGVSARWTQVLDCWERRLAAWQVAA